MKVILTRLFAARTLSALHKYRRTLYVLLTGLALLCAIFVLPISRASRLINRSSVSLSAPLSESTSRTVKRSDYTSPALVPVTEAPTNLAVGLTSNTIIRLIWTAPQGSVSQYRIERSQSISGPFTVIGNTTNTTFDDTSVGTVTSYLYRVRAVDGAGALSSPSNIAVGTAVSFTDPELQAGVTEIKAAHLTQLRQAVNAMRQASGLSNASWAHPNLSNAVIYASDVQELRDQLAPALTALSIPASSYSDSQLSAQITLIKKVHIEQLRQRATMGSSTSSGLSDPPTDTNARLDPLNRTGGSGEDPLSRNFNWTVPLVSLPGRAGLDLGLSLSYNSLATWTRQGSSISFDDDNGFPAPGFRLGFPIIESAYYSSQTGKHSFLMITPSGARVELRQVGTSDLYQAVDSSYLLLDVNTMVLRTTDGTKLQYAWRGDGYKCTQIKDRNGNFITINYDPSTNRLASVIDTLNRTIAFNYDANDLTSITQSWYGQTHYWARFTYGDKTIQTSFAGLTVYGPANNTAIHALTQVKLADDSHYDFDYTSWGQVWKISEYTNESSPHLLNYRSYDLPVNATNPQSDCPRFTQRHDWAENWNLDSGGNAQEVLTYFDAPLDIAMPDNSLQTVSMAKVTTPDGTSQRLYYAGSVNGGAGSAPAWQRGLLLRADTYEAGNSAAQRSSVTTWEQDDESVAYSLNPRVKETNISDPSGNHARTCIEYIAFNLADGTTVRLPENVKDYQADASTVLRRTHITYRTDSSNSVLLDPVYANLRIIGLVSEKTLYEVNPGTGAETLMSRVSYGYDESGSLQGSDAPIQHDNTNFSSSFVSGRANVSSVTRHNVETSQSTTSTIKYNTAGAVVKTTDPLGHSVSVDYTDQFSANGQDLDSSGGFSTLAYPTTVTDPDGFTSTTRYNYAFGGATRKQTPRPNETTTQAGNQNGPEQITEYDSFGRLIKIRNTFNGAYTRFEYHPTYTEAFATVKTLGDDAHSMQFFDGAGRIIGKVRNHPDSVGGFSAQRIYYDKMGRIVKQSNPTETNASGTNPYAWSATGDDDPANGGLSWKYSQQTYDWKGRPLVTTHPDNTTKSFNYAGCGCAGGEVVTLTDEGTIDGVGVAKRRQQRIYSDVLGRKIKTELLNWEGGAVYSATVNTYNARDQITVVRQWAGVENGSGVVYQDTTMGYDGYGRLETKHLPEYDFGTNTTFAYNDDDTVHSVTDPRGASATYGYNNNRHLVTSIVYSAPYGIISSPNVAFSYDAAGNRVLMTDGLGSQSYSYNQLSQMTSETRTFAAPFNHSYTLGYEYNYAGEVKIFTNSVGETLTYDYDLAGRAQSIANNYNQSYSHFLSSAQYRAWGGMKSATFGDSVTESATYNANLEMTSRRVLRAGAEVAATSSYEYYADGALRYSKSQDQRFNRAFAYDHTARITEAYSGLEADQRNNIANSEAPMGPYRQSYQYNGFSQTTYQVDRIWSQSQTTNNTYVNNRLQGWTYDAAGGVTNNGTYNYDRDAAGRPVQFGSGGFYSIKKYDGDGNLAATGFTNVYGQDPIRSYYLYSSVLGTVVSKLYASNGQREESYVYAAGQKIATASPWQAIFTHQDPVTGSTAQAEFNADGINVGFAEPTAPTEDDDVGFKYPEIAGGSTCSVGNPNCVSFFVDGLPEPNWGRIKDLALGGALALRMRDGSYQPLDVQLGQLGVVSVYARYRETHDANEIEFDRYVYGFNMLDVPTAGPQNSTVVPLGNLEDNLNSLLKHGDCEAFTNRVLAALAEKYAQPAHFGHINSIMQGYNMIQAQGKYVLEPSGISTVRGDLFNSPSNYDAGPGTVVIAQNDQRFRIPTAAQTAVYQALYAFAALHETFHLGKRGGYTDEQVARIMMGFDGVEVPDKLRSDGTLLSSLPTTDFRRIALFSNEVDQALKRHCGYPTTPLAK